VENSWYRLSQLLQTHVICQHCGEDRDGSVLEHDCSVELVCCPLCNIGVENFLLEHHVFHTTTTVVHNAPDLSRLPLLVDVEAFTLSEGHFAHCVEARSGFWLRDDDSDKPAALLYLTSQEMFVSDSLIAMNLALLTPDDHECYVRLELNTTADDLLASPVVVSSQTFRFSTRTSYHLNLPLPPFCCRRLHLTAVRVGP
jgi:hypothetical protein